MRAGGFVVKSVLSGVLVLVPIYVALLLLLKAVKSLAALIKPIARLLPDWLPAANLLAVIAVLLLCFVVGALVHTRAGHAAQDRVEQRLARSLPGYATMRGLTHRLLGESDTKSWRPALAEIEEALVPAFIIEELADGRFTVFVPSIPTPLAGAVYLLSPERVHPVDIPFTQAIRVVSQWGSGCGKLAAAMKTAG